MSEESSKDIPQCESVIGHKWLHRYREEDGEIVEVLSRHCARCGVVDDDPDVGIREDPEPENFRCKIGWHSYRRTGRVNQADECKQVCKRCSKVRWV